MSATPEPATAAYEPATYWTARLAGDAGLEAVGYRGLGEAYNHWLYRRRAALFRRLARVYGWDRRPPSVLELGPGTGFYVALWAALGVRNLTGIDIAPPAVARLRRRFPAYQFLAADIGRPLALPPRSFDVVTAFDVLFHITDDEAFGEAIGTIARALRPGGVALITDLFPTGDAIRLPHQLSRTAATYRTVLAANGLLPVRRWPVFVLMHPWSRPRPAARLWWAAVTRLAGHVPGAGAALGPALFAADSVLTRLASPGPSTQLWALQRAED